MLTMASASARVLFLVTILCSPSAHAQAMCSIGMGTSAPAAGPQLLCSSPSGNSLLAWDGSTPSGSGMLAGTGISWAVGTGSAEQHDDYGSSPTITISQWIQLNCSSAMDSLVLSNVLVTDLVFLFSDPPALLLVGCMNVMVQAAEFKNLLRLEKEVEFDTRAPPLLPDQLGTAIVLNGSTVSITNASFSVIHSTQPGGAMALVNASAFVSDTLFFGIVNDGLKGSDDLALLRYECMTSTASDQCVFEYQDWISGGGAIFLTGCTPEMALPTQPRGIHALAAVGNSPGFTSWVGLQLENVTFSNCSSSDGPGGAVLLNDQCAILAVNVSWTACRGSALAINSTGSLPPRSIIVNSSFTDNYRGYTHPSQTSGGSAARLFNASLTTVNVVFKNNVADHGGAMHFDSCSDPSSLRNTSFVGNTAGYGAAIFASNSRFNITDCQFSSNIVGEVRFVEGDRRCGYQFWLDGKCRGGGAVHLNSSSLTMSDTLFRGNQGVSGGALALSDCSVPSSLTNVHFTNNIGETGGAVWANSSSTLTVQNCSFVDNISVSPEYYPPNVAGGALYLLNTPLAMYDSRLTGNRAFQGGAIHLDSCSTSSSVVNNTWFEQNYVTGGYLGRSVKGGDVACGGAIHAQHSAPLIVTNSSFRNNTARGTLSNWGGAGHFLNSSLVMSGSNLHGNQADSGGALFFDSCINTSSLTSCNLTGHTAQQGGAVYARSAPLTITDTVFSNNLARSNGGALYVFNAPVSLQQARFERNSATLDGGAVLANGIDLTVRGCVFENNVLRKGGINGGAAISAHPDFYSTEFNILALYNTQFQQNQVQGAASVVHVSTLLYASNCTISGNAGSKIITLDFVAFPTPRAARCSAASPASSPTDLSISLVEVQCLDGSLIWPWGPDVWTHVVMATAFLNNTGGPAVYVNHEAIRLWVHTSQWQGNEISTRQASSSFYLGPAMQAAFPSTTLISNSTVQHNTAAGGGAIRVQGNTTIVHSRFIGNTAGAIGGAVTVLATDVTPALIVHNCSFEVGAGQAFPA